jgi:hypothetical protein
MNDQDLMWAKLKGVLLDKQQCLDLIEDLNDQAHDEAYELWQLDIDDNAWASVYQQQQFVRFFTTLEQVQQISIWHRCTTDSDVLERMNEVWPLDTPFSNKNAEQDRQQKYSHQKSWSDRHIIKDLVTLTPAQIKAKAHNEIADTELAFSLADDGQ